MSRKRQHSVTVEIAGERHVLRSDASPEYTHSVAAHVDRTIRDLSPAQVLNPQKVAILAALFITDELFRAREELQRLHEDLERRAIRLADLLERAGEPDAPTAETGLPDSEPGSQSGS